MLKYFGGREILMKAVIILAIIILIVVSFFSSPQGKGIVGEFITKLFIGRTKEGKKYVFNNYKIVINGKSSQIDHIVVNKNGVFVIETKNYSGEIYGSENQMEWTQVLAGGNVENKFYNPVKQNKSHIYQLSQILPSNIKIHSLVVFTKNNTQHIKSSAVCSVYDIRARLKHEEENSLSTKEILQVSQILFENKNDKLSKRKHIKNIKKMFKILKTIFAQGVNLN